MDTTTDRPGFTLVELMVVMVVIGILAVMAMAQTGRATRQANLAVMQADLREFVVRQELYYNANLRYAVLDELPNFTTSQGVTVEVPWVQNDGYAAVAVHAGLADRTCGVFTGPAPDGAAAPALEPGQITCEP